MNDSDSPWEIISSEYLHKAPWLTVRKDHVVLPNGNHIPSYYILEYPEYPYQYYVLLFGYRCGKDFGAASGRYGKPQRTSAYACRSKGAAAKRRDKASADGRSIVEIYSRERTIIRLPLYSNGLRNVQPPFHSEQP